MSLTVVNQEMFDAHSEFRRGFTWGIMMGFMRGITLEDHPLHPAKPLLRWPARGSAGVPDSLGHKPEDTSGGRTGQHSRFPRWPPCPVWHQPRFCHLSYSVKSILCSYHERPTTLFSSTVSRQRRRPHLQKCISMATETRCGAPRIPPK
jgi:hypothetical protein